MGYADNAATELSEPAPDGKVPYARCQLRTYTCNVGADGRMLIFEDRAAPC
jgi:hypothetical protein